MYSLGTRLVFAWYSRVSLVVLTWYSLGIPLVLACFSRSTRFVLACYLLVSLLDQDYGVLVPLVFFGTHLVLLLHCENTSQAYMLPLADPL